MTDLIRGSSEWWLDRLGQRLTARAASIQVFDDYYSGRQGRRFIGTKYRELFARLFETYCENFCGIVVDAVAERLEVQGFRFPSPDRGTKDELVKADDDAWRIWQDNGLDAASQIAHTEALVKGIVYVLVSPFEAEFVGGRSPRITIEDARETIVEVRAGSQERIVGMKRWLDTEAETYYATLYFPDRVEKWRADGRHTPATIASRSAMGERIIWKHREIAGETWPLLHDVGVVPIVPLVNRPRMSGEGESEIAKVIPLQDAINTIASNELVASEAAAFPQKWATGIEIPMGDDGKPMAPWKPDIERILSTPLPDAHFGQFMPADLSQWGDAVDRKIKRIASITQTPYHYFLDHGGQPPSGDSIKSSETGLVRKTGAKQLHIGEGWEEVERIAFKAMGDSRADILDSETIWAPVETMSESEHVDALVKMASLGVPDEVLWEKWGASPLEIERWKTIQAEDSLLRPEPLPSLKPLAPTQTSPLPPTEPQPLPVTRVSAG